VVRVQETNRVRFLDDRRDDPFEYDVVKHNGELVVKGHINKIEKTPKRNRELAYDEEGLMEDGEDERCGQASDEQADEQESADMEILEHLIKPPDKTNKSMPLQWGDPGGLPKFIVNKPHPLDSVPKTQCRLTALVIGKFTLAIGRPKSSVNRFVTD